MKRLNLKKYSLAAVLLLMFSILFGAAHVSAASTLQLLDYSQVNYAKNISLPVTNHIWRIRFTNLNKASSATATSSNNSVASVAVYNNSLKNGCIYVAPHKKGTTTINVSFSYKSSTGKMVPQSYSVNLSVSAWSNPLKKAQIGKTNNASLFKKSNFTTSAKISSSKAMVYMVPNSGWTLKGIYAQGLKKSGSSYVYGRTKIANKAAFNFGQYVMKPDLYVQVYNAKTKMNITLLLSGS